MIAVLSLAWCKMAGSDVQSADSCGSQTTDAAFVPPPPYSLSFRVVSILQRVSVLFERLCETQKLTLQNRQAMLHGQSRLLGQQRAGQSTRPCINRPAARRASISRAVDKEGSLAQGREWLGSILSRFGPATDRAQNITTLEFEKPLLELDKRIKEVSIGGMVCRALQSPRPTPL